MEDVPIGDLGRMVEEIESSDTSIADAFGLCPECGAKIADVPHYESCPRRRGGRPDDLHYADLRWPR